MSAPTLTEDKLTFVYCWFCPFAQRTWISLKEKGVDYNAHEISADTLFGKPDWFKALHPKGNHVLKC